jgi:tRNA A-37 threonylcarbamoyl transferase component Bud32
MPAPAADITADARLKAVTDPRATIALLAMSTPRLIGPPHTGSSVGTSPSSTRRRLLPDDLLRDASRRLGIIALVAAALWGIGTVLFHVAMAQTDPAWLHWQSSDGIAVVGLIISLALFAYTRGTDRDPAFILDLGLVYMVLTSAAAGQLFHWDVMPRTTSVMPTISWLGALVLVFAAILPSTPVKILIAGLISVSMNPIGMLVAKARGTWDFGSSINVLSMHYQDYLLVGVAVVISSVVTGLGQKIARAREMGSYQLGELLGRGGMGEVFKATHRMLARPAAVKLIRPAMIGDGSESAARVAATRFRREATAAANLRSPHTVELYDFGVTEDGTLYFAMELLEGLTLEALVQQTGPLPASRVIHVLRQVCESLEEAHRSGLVHRDIKPANIHIGRLGLQHDFVKVLDFGLVKSAIEVDATQSLATGLGVAAGTPAYMAPEMALGQTLDGRADLYSLGCVAYYLITGQIVFEADNGLQMLMKRLNQDPLPPSARTELPVPADLERVVLACLARLPDDRPQSAAELNRALAAVPGELWGEEQAMQWWSTYRPDASG